MFAHKKEYAHISKQMELVKPFIIFLELPVIFSPRRGALHLYIIERKKGVKIPAQRNPQTSPRRWKEVGRLHNITSQTDHLLQ